MKKIIHTFALCCAVLGANVIAQAIHAVPAPSSVNTVLNDWEKAKDGTWPGMMNSQKYWYKLDKNAKLWWSTDGKKWSEVPDGMWADKDGKWMKIDNKTLVWSADLGKTWTEVPERKWEASNGKMYKFDADWTVWVK